MAVYAIILIHELHTIEKVVSLFQHSRCIYLNEEIQSGTLLVEVKGPPIWTGAHFDATKSTQDHVDDNPSSFYNNNKNK